MANRISYHSAYVDLNKRKEIEIIFEPSKQKAHYSQLKAYIKEELNHDNFIISLMKKITQ